MDFNKYVNNTANVYAKNRFYKFVILCLIGLLISQQIILADAYRNHTVIIVPPGLKDKVSLSGNSFDTTYLQAMGVYVSNLMYTFTPSTVIGQYQTLVELLSPENYDINSKNLTMLGGEYKENDVASNFQVLGIKILKDPDVIEVKGEVTRFAASEKMDGKPVTLRIKFINVNGLFRISAVEESK